MKLIEKNTVFGTFMLLVCLCARSADTDLFAGAAPTGSDAPQVLFVMDTGASFSASNSSFRCNISASGVVKTDGTGLAADFTALDGSNGGVEQCAIYSVISALPITTTSVSIGVMMFNAGQKAYNALNGTFSSDCTGGIGGCLAMPIVPFNSTTKPLILSWIQAWVTSGSNNYNIKAPASRGDGATMQEAWAYYFGKTGISGRNYSAVAPSSNCASKNIIFIGNNYASQASPKDATTAAASPKNALEGTHGTVGARANPAATTTELASIVDTLPLSCRTGVQSLDTAENKGAYALNWARYLRDQGVVTNTIGIVGPTCDAAYDVQLNKMGSTEVGGGKYYSTSDFTTLVNAFNTIISEIQSVNSVFAAVSLPVSVNTQGSYLNQVFVGMFRPEEGFFPRWNGNLKQYKIGQSGSNLRLEDADSTAAINGLTGFITECARSYWTPNTVDTYWSANPSGGCLTVANSKSSNYPDGNIVEKGAQAYKLRNLTPSARTVKTCSPVFASCTALTDFSTSNAVITQALLNSGGTDRDALINWARGQNLNDELDKTTSVMRPSSHGDVVHSRPVAVNHGTDVSPSVVVYYGGNDGLLRAVNGNRGSATNAATGAITSGGATYNAGDEIWSFMPPEFYGKVKRLRDNSIPISYPTSSVASAQAKDYSIDGPITAFNGSIGGSPKTYLYATMRRGGRAAYAFDVTTPGSPALLWKLGCPNIANDTSCATGFASIGQTWGSMKPMFASGYGSGASPMLIMGGGYDNCEDYDALVVGGKNHNCTVAATKGNKIFVLDAVTGAIVKSFSTDRAVVADVTVVRDSAGMAKYGYTADMGGNVYRIEFGSGNPTSWSMTKIASLGCDIPATCSDSTANRKFMFPPSVVTLDNVTYYVLLGSGDREKPVKEYLASKSVTNYFFMLKDKPSDNTWLSSENVNCIANLICKASLLAITSNSTPTDASLALKKGWYLGLAATEQIVTSAVTVFGTVTFSSHQPAITSASACVNNLGTTNVYNINYLNAVSANGTAQRYEQVSGGGLPPSPDAGQVTLDNGQVVPFVVGSKPTSPLEFALPTGGGSTSQSKSRIYWYIQK